MCGLVGVVGHIDSTHERMFKMMLQLDTLRGHDSTGMLQVSVSKNMSVLKAVGTPWDLMGLKKYDTFFNGFHHLLLGHNRSATRGSVSYHNAHPFECGDIVGAHNGTLTSTYNLDGHGKFDVDSEVVFNHMDVNGPEDTVNKIQGAFALTWYNKFEKTFNIVRNSERPMYYAIINNGKTFVYASEAWMIVVAGIKVNIDIDIKTDVQILPVAQHFEIPLPKETSYALATQTPLVINKHSYELYKFNYNGGQKGNNPFRPSGTTSTTNTGTTAGMIDTKKYMPVETKKSNVVAGNFPSGNSSKQYKVIFEVTGYGKTINSKMDYIAGRIIEVSGMKVEELLTNNVRIFPKRGDPDWRTMMESPYYFEAQTKKHSDSDGGYYTILSTSIKELTNYVDDGEDVYEGYGGMPMTRDEFRKAYKDCYMCGNPIDPNDAGNSFLSDHECMCGHCTEELEDQNIKGGV